MKRIWITGYRSYELNVFKDNDPKVKVIQSVLERYLKEQLEQSEEELWAITGPQMGVERWTIEVATRLKDDYSQLKVAMMLPFAEFGKQWNEENQMKLANATQKVDFFANVSEKPYQSPQQLRNYQQFMLNHTDEALLLYDPEHEGKPKYDYVISRKFSNNNDYQVRLIDFDELQEAAEEWTELQREKYEQ
ncbi:DUF1273 domain-containing protein [Limosilactobacillus sp. STM2_1]|uniref:UPF0398 protein H5S09_02300 n=1 Tax=Limosilactobacillus rudii TaxID=2759755 RepID=A0A7W3UJM7_9LACO|nr:DUF1273 domain-containing protein [Limosilactobacillus rudii]MBB1078644.1 DUF1273 domain-containing protein [Limosilactobacillus rudii]MBB1096788.1 DUF1273 domain-containing protein [Limosilactobacillus rudii]MCD7135540.1 DUF1273 domain-containing protein [Limosilactobacillus rudii]